MREHRKKITQYPSPCKSIGSTRVSRGTHDIKLSFPCIPKSLVLQPALRTPVADMRLGLNRLIMSLDYFAFLAARVLDLDEVDHISLAGM
jgi:hypothetical protein